MRSYWAHLETLTPSTKKTTVEPKPTFRSSSLFPMIHQPGITSRVLFLGYWILKRHIQELSTVTTLRSEEGEVLFRRTGTIRDAKTYRIELTDLLRECDISTEESFIGSLEVEFFSVHNLVFPFPALVINYYGPEFSSVVHTAQRVYNDYGDMVRNSQTDVPESGFNIYADADRAPFFSLINGPKEVPDSTISMDFFNQEGETLTHQLKIGTLKAYQTKIIYPGKEVDLAGFLKGKAGAAKVKFHVNWAFPRLVAGNVQRSLPALAITHTYYDCSQAQSDSDYWRPTEAAWYPASLMIPVTIQDSHFTKAYFYPIYSPSFFTVDVEIYNNSGVLLGTKQEALKIQSPAHDLKEISMKELCQDLGITPEPHLGARIIARNQEGECVPARIKLGLDLGQHPDQMPCNICTNLQPFTPPMETKPRTFRWSPVLADQKRCSIWIMNSSPSVNYEKDAEVEITFFREKDTQTLSRKVSLPPHGFKVILPHEDKELDTFFDGQVGWLTAISTNPYTTTYYFAEHSSGVVGGDHGF